MHKKNQVSIVTVFMLCFLVGLAETKILNQRQLQTPEKTSSNIATRWMHFITDQARKEGTFPPPSLRLYAYTGLALYESVLPGMKDQQSLFTALSGRKIYFNYNGKFHYQTCANTAVAELLKKLNILKTQTAVDSMQIVCLNSFENVPESQRTASILFGKAVADSIYNWSKTDGTFDSLKAYSPATGPAYWDLPPGTLPIHAGLRQGYIRSFITNVNIMVDPGPPPAYSEDVTSDFYQNVDEIYTLRKNISITDSLFVISWQPRNILNYSTMSHLQKLLTLFLEKENMSLEQAVIIYAKNGMAMSDAVGASLYAKHKYNLLNPGKYIENIMHQSNWQSVYPYDNYPSYPSNVVACVSASAAIMGKLFGENYQFTDSLNNSKSVPYSYFSFEEFTNAVARQQMQSGLDYRFSVEAAKTQGNKIAAMINNFSFGKAR